MKLVCILLFRITYLYHNAQFKTKGRFTRSMPCSDSAMSFVKVRMAARNIRTASPTDRLFCTVLLPLFSSSMTNAVWFHTGHLHLRLLCFW